MLSAYATGLIGLLTVLVAWVAVQQAWRRMFVGATGDPDALAGRLGCRGACDDSHACTRSCPKDSTDFEEEER